MTSDRLNDLADFLKTRRNRLKPESLGLPSGQRRRTSGLRREEVAELAGISVTWYTWLEQGRPVSMSMRTIERIASALRLDDAERQHLFSLAKQAAPDNSTAEDNYPIALMQTILDSLGTNPAYVTDRLWNLLAWNEMADRIYNFSHFCQENRNVLRFFLTNPVVRTMWINWDEDIRDFLAQFRADQVHANTAERQKLLKELQSVSPEFQVLWNEHEILKRSGWSKELEHPQMGRLSLESIIMERDIGPYFRMVIYTPAPQTGTASKLSKLLRP